MEMFFILRSYLHIHQAATPVSGECVGYHISVHGQLQLLLRYMVASGCQAATPGDMQEVRTPMCLDTASTESRAIDIPGNSSNLTHARHGSVQSYGSPARPYSVLSASSGAYYNASGHSSLEEGRSNVDMLPHMHSMHGRSSSGTLAADQGDSGQLDLFLSSELEAARSELFSSMNMGNSPVATASHSPGNPLMGPALPQGGGHFGGYFRGRSAGGTAGPGSYGIREDISALAAAVPRVLEGSPRVQVSQRLAPNLVSPGNLDTTQYR
jgi:hypothetical protein